MATPLRPNRDALLPSARPIFRTLSRTTSISAFSLIECVMAIGIVAFAMVTMVGLMPVGLTAFQKSMDTSTSSRIVQQVVTDIQQGTNTLSQQPLRYFDDQGVRQADANKRPLYYVNTVVAASTQLPGGNSSALATVTVEIVKNPQNTPLEKNPSTSFVIEKPGMSVTRFPVFIATQG